MTISTNDLFQLPPNTHLGFVGAGQMATALARGFVKAGLIEAGNVTATDPSEAARELFAANLRKARVVESNEAALLDAGMIVLAVKPQAMAEVCRPLAKLVTRDHLFISIAAGVRIASLAEWLGTERIIRVMPNTPALVGKTAAAWCAGPNATANDGRLVAGLLASMGQAVEVEESQMDAVTGLSGSGPAYIFEVIEALAAGGELMGLPRDKALLLAAQTVYGAAAMVLETGEEPTSLANRVKSPGGTTLAGCQVLEERGMRGAFIAAVEAATRRGEELGSGGGIKN